MNALDDASYHSFSESYIRCFFLAKLTATLWSQMFNFKGFIWLFTSFNFFFADLIELDMVLALWNRWKAYSESWRQLDFYFLKARVCLKCLTFLLDLWRSDSTQPSKLWLFIQALILSFNLFSENNFSWSLFFKFLNLTWWGSLDKNPKGFEGTLEIIWRSGRMW